LAGGENHRQVGAVDIGYHHADTQQPDDTPLFERHSASQVLNDFCRFFVEERNIVPATKEKHSTLLPEFRESGRAKVHSGGDAVA
jgi:hypothetical protein